MQLMRDSINPRITVNQSVIEVQIKNWVAPTSSADLNYDRLVVDCSEQEA